MRPHHGQSEAQAHPGPWATLAVAAAGLGGFVLGSGSTWQGIVLLVAAAGLLGFALVGIGENSQRLAGFRWRVRDAEEKHVKWLSRYLKTQGIDYP